MTLRRYVAFALLCVTVRIVTSAQELRLSLEDNFDNFDLSLWKHELTLGGGGNGEFQWYANNRSNSYVEGGVLHLRPTILSDIIGEAPVIDGHRMDIWGQHPADVCTANAFNGCERTSNSAQGGSYINPIVSARIRTSESFSFTYGKVEIRAKLPRGDWLWPAIRLLPTDHQYGEWPASGEINIMNARGNDPSYEPGGYDTVASSLHWGPYFQENRLDLTYAEKSGIDFSSDSHVFGLLWTSSYIRTYIDDPDNVVLSVDTDTESFWSRGGWDMIDGWENPWRGRGPNAPFDRRFYIVISLAVGGVSGFFPDGYGKPWQNSEQNPINSFYGSKDDWLTTWNQTFQIDSVMVWTYGEGNGDWDNASMSPSMAVGDDDSDSDDHSTVIIVGAIAGVLAVALLLCGAILATVVMMKRRQPSAIKPPAAESREPIHHINPVVNPLVVQQGIQEEIAEDPPYANPQMLI